MNVRSAVVVLFFAAASLVLGAQTLTATPGSVLIDQTTAIRATGLPPGSTVTIAADLVDGRDQPWAATADFQADAQGSVDVTTQAPLRGSYHGVSAMGLIWSMRPTAKDVHFYAPPRNLGAEVTHLHLLQNGKDVADADLVQNFVAAGVQQIHLEGVLHGTLLVPPGTGKHPGVLVVGGSEGGLPSARAAWLASHGYAALALAYFHYEGLPEMLRNIPLEYFGEALSWMSKRPEIDGSRLAVMGTSRGGELALQLGSMYPDIHAVVAYLPANVRVSSCCGRPFGAAWTWQGMPLAWANPWPRYDPASMLQATIRVESIHGPVLMIGGEADGVWPSADMVHSAADRLHREHFPWSVVTLIYPHAGHRAGMPQIVPAWNNGVPHPLTGRVTDLGGTPEGNAASTLDAIPRVLDFLSTSLGVTPASPAAVSAR
ncbi:MAG TPA: acyl-CoA thioester hydrolase/BAAT C-terminal domain-containing protein [Acidobacteriaceae bacterium]|nr:acyl-CoA thioester hydrolase/BAAT C-terminal domain-containing protein [Acidobacteriaceae bacterium]